MAKKTVQPILLNDIVLRVEEDDYEAHVSRAELVPTTSVVTFKGMTPSSVHQFPTSPTWVLNLDLAQDWAAADSLSNYLFDNAGEIKTFTLAPKSDGPAFAVDAICTPGSIGGAGEAVATSSVSLPASGQPERVAAITTPGA